MILSPMFITIFKSIIFSTITKKPKQILDLEAEMILEAIDRKQSTMPPILPANLNWLSMCQAQALVVWPSQNYPNKHYDVNQTSIVRGMKMI